MMTLSRSMLDALKRHVPRSAHAPGHVVSAVLLPVLADREGDHLLYTKRSNSVDSHRGQICFPGGKWSAEDVDLRSTALRESWEELAIVPDDVEILGQLDDMITLTGFVITPFVGRLHSPYPLRPNDEIACLLTVPLAGLLGAHGFEPGTTPALASLEGFEYAGERIWGATGRMTQQFIDILRGETCHSRGTGRPPEGSQARAQTDALTNIL